MDHCFSRLCSKEECGKLWLMYPNTVCCLFLYGPWANNDFYIFKWPRGKKVKYFSFLLHSPQLVEGCSSGSNTVLVIENSKLIIQSLNPASTTSVIVEISYFNSVSVAPSAKWGILQSKKYHNACNRVRLEILAAVITTTTTTITIATSLLQGLAFVK